MTASRRPTFPPPTNAAVSIMQGQSGSYIPPPQPLQQQEQHQQQQVNTNDPPPPPPLGSPPPHIVRQPKQQQTQQNVPQTSPSNSFSKTFPQPSSSSQNQNNVNIELKTLRQKVHTLTRLHSTSDSKNKVLLQTNKTLNTRIEATEAELGKMGKLNRVLEGRVSMTCYRSNNGNGNASTVNGGGGNSDMITNLKTEVSILREALEFRTSELGLSSTSKGGSVGGRDGGKGILYELARLKGENKEMRSMVSENESVSDCGRSELNDAKRRICELEGLLNNGSKTTTKTMHNGSSGEIDYEKDALLEYVSESLDNVAKLSERNTHLENENEKLTNAMNSNDNNDIKLKQLKNTNEDLNTELSKKQNEIVTLQNEITVTKNEVEEQSSMQIEMLSQLSSLSTESHLQQTTIDQLTTNLSEIESDYDSLKHVHKDVLNAFNVCEGKLNNRETKLSEVLPRLEECDAELRVLRVQCDKLPLITEERNDLRLEVQGLRVIKERLGGVNQALLKSSDSEEGGFSEAFNDGVNIGLSSNSAIESAIAKNTGEEDKRTTKTKWHASWVHSPSFNLLLPVLNERIKLLYTDLSITEVNSTRVTEILDTERKDRELERRVLGESVVRLQLENDVLSEKLSEVKDERVCLKGEVEKARSAENAIAQLRTVWIEHCRQGSNSEQPPSSSASSMANISEASNSAIVTSTSRALYSGRQALQRADTTLQKLIESEAMVNMRTHELHSSTTQCNADRLHYQTKLNEVENENWNLQNELTSVNGELENAAELSERQGALSVTLQSRLEQIIDDRDVLNAKITDDDNTIEYVRKQLNSSILNSNKEIQNAGMDSARLGSCKSLAEVSNNVVCVIQGLAVRCGNLHGCVVEGRARSELGMLNNNGGNGSDGISARSQIPKPFESRSLMMPKDEALTIERKSAAINEIEQNNSINDENENEGDESAVDLKENKIYQRNFDKQKAELSRMQLKYTTTSKHGGGGGRGAIKAFAGDFNVNNEDGGDDGGDGDEKKFTRMEQMKKTKTSNKIEDKPDNNNTSTPKAKQPSPGGERPPSPGTQILQDRLKRAQMQFNNLTR